MPYIKIANTDKAGLTIIKLGMKVLKKDRLIELKALLETFPDSQEKQQIKDMLKKRYKKKHLEWID